MTYQFYVDLSLKYALLWQEYGQTFEGDENYCFYSNYFFLFVNTNQR